ncbi:PilZ domain-containing protein [Cellulomonas edaphi]|uniref:PilZ domain-containing protein n=1 Tax=Cellulomonas edaphi TaxID=3053468 RepID=A0ABT7S5T8_9CELL|nr:PilZ domain-containing protein [Cellulomons edaphi]MDM7830874.1 PilZ domain-containing protein [Cellulomons edaphi]
MHDLARCTVTAGDVVLDGYVADFDGATMSVGTEAGRVGSFRDGDDVTVLVLDEVRGEVRYSGWVAAVRGTGLQLAGLELTSMLQKRKVARVRIAQICTGTVGADEDSRRTMTFTVLDIGAHGMRISTTERLVVAERIAFRFPLADRTLSLQAEVVRSQRTPSGAHQFGCRFVGLAAGDLDAMFRYVMRAQGAQRRARLQS